MIHKNVTNMSKPSSVSFTPHYYSKIKNIKDLSLNNLTTVNLGSIYKPNYYIAAPKVNYDATVEEVIKNLEYLIDKRIEVPLTEDILSFSLQEIVGKYKKDSVDENIKSFLLKEGYSGDLIKVSQDINKSRIDSVTRKILSNENIFFFLAFKTIQGNGITDVKGISTNIIDSVGLIKSYINTEIVDKIITNSSLDVSGSEKAKIKRELKNKSISYLNGEPRKVVLDRIKKIKSGGSLYDVVLKFINDGKVKLPNNVNKNTIVQKMVDYLLQLGYTTGETNETEEIAPDKPDDFAKSIDGIGGVINDALVNAGIVRFYQLASYSAQDLKSKLKLQTTSTDFEYIIKQAECIAEGRFDDLIELQNKD